MMLKKFISTGITCVLCLSMSTAAFAQNGGDPGWSGGNTSPFRAPVPGFTEDGVPIGAYTEDGVPINASAPVAGVSEDGAAQMLAYTVQQGDTLGHLSVNYYGSYNYHKSIYQANKATLRQSKGAMTPGMVLNLPYTIGKANLIQPAVANEGETLYWVKSGDTLGKIAQAHGSSSNQIFERNKDRLVNVNRIYEGQIIVLPA